MTYLILDLMPIALGAYLIGSIPFGLILTKLAGHGDIRQIGSGNIGATNVLRTGNKKLALATLVLDFGKAFVPIPILFGLMQGSCHADSSVDITIAMTRLKCLTILDMPYVNGYKPIAIFYCLFVVLGHMFPIWLKFKGGKGVACIFGLTFALSWIAGLFISVLWLALFFSTGYSSLAALLGIPAGLMLAANFGLFEFWPAMVLPVLLMAIKHHQNIRRLLKGEEHRFALSKKDKG